MKIQPDMVFHLAGTTKRGLSCEDWTENIKGNILTTSSMIQAISSLPPKKRPDVIYPGSQMEYGISPMPWTEQTLCRPSNPYGVSKLASTELLLSAERAEVLKACVARLAILYGPAQSATMFIPKLISNALAGEDFEMTEGRQKRRFLYVNDAASFLLNLGASLSEGNEVPALINAPASEPISIRQIAKLLVKCVGTPVTLKIGATPSRKYESLEAWPDDSLAKSLGYSCSTKLDDGFQKTAKWYKNNPWFFQDV